MLKKIIFWLPIVMFTGFLILKVFYNDLYNNMIQEDTFVEELQAWLYFLSFIAAFTIAIRFLLKKAYLLSTLFLLFSVAMLVICLEEISWGQRIFEIENPIYFEEHNTQKEISIHNLSAFQHLISEIYIIISFAGAFSWLILPKVFNDKNLEKIKFLYPAKYISSFFLIPFLIYILLEWIIPLFVTSFGIESMDIGNFFVWRDQEPAELILALGFLFFTIDTLMKQSAALKLN